MFSDKQTNLNIARKHMQMSFYYADLSKREGVAGRNAVAWEYDMIASDCAELAAKHFAIAWWKN